MPLTGDHRKFRRFVAEMQHAASGRGTIVQAVAGETRRALQARLKHQFKTGVGADDATHARRADGKPALVSSRLGSATRARAVGATIWVEPKTPHVGDILDTQQEGHVYGARSGRAFQYRDKRNRIVSYTKFVRAVRDTTISEVTRGATRERIHRRTDHWGKVRWVATRSITDRVKFGRRVIPPRMVRPVRDLTDAWQRVLVAAFERGLRNAVGRYAE